MSEFTTPIIKLINQVYSSTKHAITIASSGIIREADAVEFIPQQEPSE